MCYVYIISQCHAPFKRKRENKARTQGRAGQRLILRGRDEETPHQTRKRRTSDFRGIVGGLRFSVVLLGSSRLPLASSLLQSSELPFLAVPSQFTSCRHFLDFCARFASGLRSPFRLKKISAYTYARARVNDTKTGENPPTRHRNSSDKRGLRSDTYSLPSISAT